jgi:hypothetical protein
MSDCWSFHLACRPRFSSYSAGLESVAPCLLVMHAGRAPVAGPAAICSRRAARCAD